MNFHPASLLLFWAAAVVALQALPLPATLAATVLSTALAGIFGRRLFLRLLFRSRWLFLTMGLLFLWLSPGIRLPEPWGSLGMTREGLEFALEHMGRLATLLALLALLLTRLDHRGVVVGFHRLLAPLGDRELRRAVAVRLMLTLETVAGDEGGRAWRSLLGDEAPTAVAGAPALETGLSLATPPWRGRDSLLTAAAVLAAAAVFVLAGGNSP